MPNNPNNSSGWQPTQWSPNGWQPSPVGFAGNAQPSTLPNTGQTQPPAGTLPPGSATQPSPNMGNTDAGLVGTPGGPPAGLAPGSVLPPTIAPNLGANNTTMPGMFSPTGIGQPGLFTNPRAILNDQLSKTFNP
jgi:hypothetical protein